MNNMQLILASSSQTRKELMDRLRIDYQSIVPDIDESPRGENHADDLAKRLAFEKAKFISDQHPNAIVIGSDQVAWWPFMSKKRKQSHGLNSEQN